MCTGRGSVLQSLLVGISSLTPLWLYQRSAELGCYALGGWIFVIDRNQCCRYVSAGLKLAQHHTRHKGSIEETGSSALVPVTAMERMET